MIHFLPRAIIQKTFSSKQSINKSEAFLLVLFILALAWLGFCVKIKVKVKKSEAYISSSGSLRWRMDFYDN